MNCKDTSLFCPTVSSPIKPYYIKQFHLSNDLNYDYLYNEYDSLLDNVSKGLEPISKIETLLCQPTNLNYHYYIFVGKFDDSIYKLLQNITSDNNINSLDKSDIDKLNNHFGYDVASIWNLPHNDTLCKSISFVPIHINNDDTFNVIKKMMVYFQEKSIIPSLDIDSFFMFYNRSISNETIKLLLDNIATQIKLTDKTKITSKVLKDLMFSFCVPDSIMSSILETFPDDIYNNIDNIINNKLLIEYLEFTLRYKPSLYSIYTHSNIEYPVNPFIFTYFNDKNQFYEKDISPYQSNVDSRITTIINNWGLPTDNIIYLYSRENIIDNYRNNYDITGEKFKIFYNKFIAKLYPLQKLDQFLKYKPEQKTDITRDSLITYNNILETYHSYEKSDKLEFISKNQYLFTIKQQLNIHTTLDLKTIFNQFELSENIPFVKMKNLNLKHMVYKIYKPITISNGNKYLPQVSKELLYSWVRNYDYDFINNELKPSHTFTPRTLIYKVRLLSIKDEPTLLNGIIHKVNDDNTYDIIVNDIIYENIPNDNVLNKPNKIVAGVEVNFYKNKYVYADIELSRKGLLKVIVDLRKTDSYICESFYQLMLNRINVFIKDFSHLEYFKDNYIHFNQFNPINLQYNNTYNNSRLSNLILGFSMTLPFTDIFAYELLERVGNQLSPFVVINEINFEIGDVVEYFDNLSKKWIKGNIQSIIKDVEWAIAGNYNISLSEGDIKTVYNINKKDIRYIGKTKNKRYLELLYRRISDFGNEGVLSPVIRIDFSSKKTETKRDTLTTIPIYVENIDSFNTLCNIKDFIVFYFNILANIHLKNKELSLFDKPLEKSANIVSELTEDEIKNKFEITTNIDFDDFFNEEENEDDIVEETDELIEPIEDVIEGEEDAIREEIKYLEKEARLDLAGIETDDSNPILYNLKQKDPSLFVWNKTEEFNKNYSELCQTIKRYPKVLTDEQKQEIDNDPNLGPETYQTLKTDKTTCSNSNDFAKSKCSAIKWGSSTDTQNWYICPRIFDVADNVPLTYKNLVFDEPFEPIDNSLDNDNWRTNKHDGRDILEFNPSYKGRKPVIKEKFTKTNTLVFLPKGSKYTYPGFNNPNNPLKLYLPCCFASNMKAKNAYGSDIISKGANTYILRQDKELGYNPYRYGLISSELHKKLSGTENIGSTGSFNSQINQFMRRGINQGANSFLSLIADFYKDGFTDTNLIDRILNYVSEDMFKTLNNGNLFIQFTTLDNQNPYHNYLEYLISNETKDYQYFYDLLTRPNDWLFPNGLHLILFENKIINKVSHIEVLCPSFCKIERNISKNAPVVFAIKKGMQFEPIYYFNGSSTIAYGKGVGNTYEDARIKIKDDFNHIMIHIDALKDHFINSCSKQIYEPVILENYQSKTSLGIVYSFKNIIDELNNLIKINTGYNIVYIIKDYYDKSVGIYLKNKLILPIYPEALSNIDNYETIYTNDINRLDLLTYDELLSKLDILRKDTKTNLNIEILKEYYNNDGLINGYLNNLGYYFPLKPSKTKALNLLNTVFPQIVDDNIKKYKDSLSKYIFTKPKIYNDTLTMLSNITDIDIIELYNVNDKILGIIIKRNNIDILIPVYPLYVSELDKNKKLKIVDKFEINSFAEYIDNAVELHTQNNNISCLPIRGIMNDKLQYTSLILETGLELKLEKKQKFNIDDKINGEYKIKILNSNPTISLWLSHLYNNINSDTGNDNNSRKVYINRIEYYKNTYELLRYEIYNLLSGYDNIRKQLHLLLFNTTYSVYLKRQLIRPIISLIFNILFKKMDIIDKLPKVDIMSPCSKTCNKGYCNTEKIDELKDIRNIREYLLSTYELEDIENMKSILINENIKVTDDDDENRDNFIDLVSSKLNDMEKTAFETSFVIYHDLKKDIVGKEKCKLILYDKDDIVYNNYYNRILEELVRNVYKRNQLLVKFYSYRKDEQYTIRKNEVIKTDDDFKDYIGVLEQLYAKSTTNIYKQLTTQSMYLWDNNEFPVEIDESVKRIKDKCIIKNKIEGTYYIYPDTRRLINNNKYNMSVKLTDKQILEYKKFLFKINENK